MESAASSPVALSSTQGPPALHIRAPLSSPEEEGDPSADSSLSSASSEQEEFFLSGEDEIEPEFDTASERPFVLDPDEEVSPEDDFGGPVEEPDLPSGEQILPPPGFFLRKPAANMPKARLSGEDEDVAEELLDEELAADVDGVSLEAQVVGDVPAADGEGVGDAGSVDGGDGILEENGGDDDEKRAEDVGVSEEASMGGASGGDTNLEVSSDDGALGDKGEEEPVSVGVGDEVSKDSIPNENLVSDGAAAAELPEPPEPMGLGDGDGVSKDSMPNENPVSDVAATDELPEPAEPRGLGDGDEVSKDSMPNENLVSDGAAAAELPEPPEPMGSGDGDGVSTDSMPNENPVSDGAATDELPELPEPMGSGDGDGVSTDSIPNENPVSDGAATDELPEPLEPRGLGDEDEVSKDSMPNENPVSDGAATDELPEPPEPTGSGDGDEVSKDSMPNENPVSDVAATDELPEPPEPRGLGDGDEVSKASMPSENPVSDGAATAELPEFMGLGDVSATVVEENALQNAGEDKHVGLGVGEEKGANPDAEAVWDSGVVKLLFTSGVINGTEENTAFYGECTMGKGSGSGAEEEKSDVSQVAPELDSDEAKSEVRAEENGSSCGASIDDNLETESTVTVEGQDWQPFETKGSTGYTEEEEEKAVISSEPKERVGEVKIDDALKLCNVSMVSGDSECSFEKADHLDRTEGADESFSSDTKKHSGEIDQASVRLLVNLKEAELNTETSVTDVYSDTEIVAPTLLKKDPADEKPDSEVAGVVEVTDSGGASIISVPDSDLKKNNDSSEGTDNEKWHMDLNEVEKKNIVADGHTMVVALGNSKTSEHIRTDLDEGSSGISSGFEDSPDYSSLMDGQIVSGSEEEVETDEEGDGKELFDSTALAALLKAATGASSDGSVTVTAPDATRGFSVEHPAGLGSSATFLKPAPPRTLRPNLFSPPDMSMVGELESNVDEEEKKLQEKVEQIRVKFLRLVRRLGHSPDDRVAAQVLYRLGLAEGIKRGRQISQLFSFENAKKKAVQLEETEKETLDFSCNILVIGKTGVGKSATINSIFGEEKVYTNAFEPVTTSVREIIGTVDGIKMHVIDTPGLKPSVMDQTANKRILASIKKYTKRCPPDIVLYVDRVDTQTWDFNDLPLLRSITSSLGSSIWFNAIIALTHAASAPPDGPNGSPLSYDVFVDQRSRIVQHAIRLASGDMRLMSPLALVENHPSCRRNREGQRVLPNGLSWKTQLLLLCFSSKILSDANSLLKLQDSSPGKIFGFRVRSPPLPFLLSSLLQSREHPKLSTDQGVDNGDSDIDLGDLSDTDQQEEEEYDQLPPFKPLRKAQIAKLTKEHKKAYFDEYDYRVKLLQRKQWKEELKRLKEMKKRGKADKGDTEYGDMVEDYDQDGAPATVPVPLPDMVLPPSFDCDNPAYRYRFLEPTSQLIVRPVLDTQGWDHDCGYDGVSIEENIPIASKFPAGISVQITKDKKDFSIHLESSASVKHGENGSSLAGFDIQSIGKQLAYILRGETKFRNSKKNKTAAGMSVTFLGENIATGFKVEDQLVVGKRLGLVGSTGVVRAQGDVAYGVNLEVRLREKDFPIGQDISTLGLSLMKWRNDLALGTNLQSQFSVGRNMKMAVRVGLTNKLSGQITVRTSTSEQLQIALMGILPIAVSIYRSIWSGDSY